MRKGRTARSRWCAPSTASTSTSLKGETLGIVGESGCGKSTTAKLLMGLIERDSGDMLFDGEAVGARAMPWRTYRRQVQMVFQDSYASLNPRMTVEDSIAFGPTVNGVPAAARRSSAPADCSPASAWSRSASPAATRTSCPAASASASTSPAPSRCEPRLVILDEAVSALDKSVEAQVLNLLLDLKAEFGLTYLFISHDLNVVRFICDRVMVMYLGRVAEIGPSDTVLAAPAPPLHRGAARLDAVARSRQPHRRPRCSPATRRTRSTRPTAAASIRAAALAEPVCAESEPPLAAIAPLHQAACLARQPGSGHSAAPGAEQVAA